MDGLGSKLKHWVLVLSVVFSAGIGLAACQADVDSSPAEVYCTTECERSAKCQGLSIDDDACIRDCVGDTWTKNIRGEVLATFAECLDNLRCEEFFSDARGECFDAAFESAEASPTCRRYCSESAAKAFECGYREPLHSCLAHNCGVVDSILAAANECRTQDACEDWEACLDQAFFF